MNTPTNTPNQHLLLSTHPVEFLRKTQKKMKAEMDLLEQELQSVRLGKSFWSSHDDDDDDDDDDDRLTDWTTERLTDWPFDVLMHD